MAPHQRALVEGSVVRIERSGTIELHEFASVQEATTRARFVQEVLTWVGTPFRDKAAVKGPNGAVDCAMMLGQSALDAGLVAPFTPPDYKPRWHLHRNEQRFLNFVVETFGARETETPRFADLHLYQFGRTFSHAAVRINNTEICHAYGAAGMCLVSRLDEHLLRFMSAGNTNFPRPVKYLDVWSR